MSKMKIAGQMRDVKKKTVLNKSENKFTKNLSEI